MQQNDFLIIGGGIIGLSIAREIIYRSPKSRIILIEKEKNIGSHASGRNSGVLHAGFYYNENSLKAKFTKDGNRLMKEYCEKMNLKINYSKKVVVATNREELKTLKELYKRGVNNGIDVELIDEIKLKKIDPNVKTYKFALFSPSTANIDPVEVNKCIELEIKAKNVNVVVNEGFLKKIDENIILTTKKRKIFAKKIINCAGLYADSVAKQFNLSKKYTIIPFKGLYVKYSGETPPVTINVYPVPNLKNPFLGVHFTLTVNNEVKIGPTATPAFWRENYTGLKNFNLKEFLQIIILEAKLFFNNSFGFRSLAIDEIKKYNKRYLIHLASKMIKTINHNDFNVWVKPGIRAQLINTENNNLVMDFIVENDKNSIHVLNAVSPAYTCAFSFSKWIVDNYIFNNNDI